MDPLQLLAAPHHGLWAMLVIAARLLPIFVVAPCFGGHLVPPLLRMGMAVCVALPLLPILSPRISLMPQDPVVMTLILGCELLVGLFLALWISVPFWAAETAGRLVDTFRGTTSAEVFSPQTGSVTSPLAQFSLLLSIVLFFAYDGHLLLFRLWAASYDVMPVGGVPSTLAITSIAVIPPWTVRGASTLLVLAISLAAPALAALFLVDLALGILNRAAPQLQSYFVGMPAKALVGILVFTLSLPMVAWLWQKDFARWVGVIGKLISS